MYKLTFEKRVWIVKQILRGEQVKNVSLAQKVSRITAFKIMQVYKEYGWDGLKDHKTGRRETTLNQNAEIIIFDLRKRFGYGPEKIEYLLKSKGFRISHRQIYKLLVRNNLVEPNIKKQKCRKWVRFELPNPNDMWHTDTTYDPFTQKQLIIYLDDKTRLVTSFGVFNRATADNSIALLKSGIASHGKPKSIMTDHGMQLLCK